MYRSLLLLAVFIGFVSCDDDFELEAPYQDLPVVYAYLNPDADDNFVRVQKAFLGTDGNAEVAARNADSLYYSEENATVAISVGSGDFVSLERVNGEDYGIDRDTGAFANVPNILYRLPASINLQEGSATNLRITRPGAEDATASTTLLSSIDIGFPTSAMGVALENYRTVTNIRWNTGTGKPQVYDIRLYLNIREFDVSDPSNTRDRRLEMVVVENYEPETDQVTVAYALDNERFWQFLGGNLEVNNEIVRRFLNMDLVVTGVGQEVKDAIAISEANSGLTSAQATPIYTNVTNGLGIYTSRVVDAELEIGLDPRNNDTLRNGIYTAPLNFQ